MTSKQRISPLPPPQPPAPLMTAALRQGARPGGIVVKVVRGDLYHVLMQLGHMAAYLEQSGTAGTRSSWRLKTTARGSAWLSRHDMTGRTNGS